MSLYASVDRYVSNPIRLVRGSYMAKKAAKKTTKKVSAKRRTGLMREIPVLHSLVTVLYILLGILFLAIYITRFA